MRTVLSKKLTYANVVATLALFLALGGTSYAAVKVTGAMVKDESLTSSDIKDHSIKARDLKTDDMPAGGDVYSTAVAGGGPWTGAIGQFFNIATLQLPAGSYALSAKVMVGSRGTPSDWSVRCSLWQDDVRRLDDASGYDISGDGDQTLPLMATAVVSSSSTIALKCQGAAGSGHTVSPLYWYSAKLQGLVVDAIH